MTNLERRAAAAGASASPGPPPFTPPQGAGDPRAVFAVLALAVFVSTLDVFIVNIAVPAIQADFTDSTVAGVSWVLNAYAIVFAALLVPAGKLGDVVGRRRVFIAGLFAFGLGSALCAASPSLGFLIAARILQGAGAAAITPASLGLLLPSIPPRSRAAAIGVWSALGAVGAASGPSLGGLLTQVSWHWIFIVNVPLTAIVLAGAYRVLPEIRDPARPPLPDGLGTLVLIAAVSLATLGLVQGHAWNWDARVIGCFAAAVVLAAVFAARSRRHRAPVLELSIVRVPAFALSALSAALFSAAFSAMLLANVLFLTGTWHYSILRAGLALTPGPVAAAVCAPFAGRLAQRVGPGLVGGAGALLFGIGSGMWVAFIGAEPAYWSLFFPAMLVGGGGVGLALPAFTIAATATLAPQTLATGIGAQTMFRQIGSALGVAAFVAVFGTPTAATVIGAHDDVRWFMIAAAAGAALALVFIRRPGGADRHPAHRQRDQIGEEA
ncbi:drug resistance transporter, EmrB/QacA subfamily [Microbispora rosea]|uniref:Drug resistance transporter, EmrB/QacA subfamily n=1 Tax=Microbispora rosea TaxID=58117 RepID=A0A1N7GW80_9ACTN|nr:MFS transporter [Microbispora rosea]GIH52356.1 MFS transporter [Microbispora rosea subsp. rosea]SIS16845.1 drug resistance transporter, EmrB/QacA subfamily [Microbispora rosea]